MNFLMWVSGMLDIYDLYNKVSSKFRGQKDSAQCLHSINGKLQRIQQILSPYTESRDHNFIHPYAPTVISADMLRQDTVVKQITESILEPELEKTVVMDKQSEIIELCKETVADLKQALTALPQLDSAGAANLACILSSQPQISQYFEAATVITREEFTISKRLLNVPQGAGNCTHCQCKITQHEIQYHRAVVRKEKLFCMKCICEKQAGDFPTIGKHRILHRLGQGGMANVYLAIHTSLRTPVALKWLKGMSNDASPDKIRRFKLECQISASLRHPNVLQFLDAGSDLVHAGKQVYYIIMEFVEGQTLEEYQQQHGNFDVSHTVKIATEISDVLDFAYCRKIVHRDLKPSNIFITKNGETKVGDFGLAKFFDKYNLSSDATKSGMAMGTIQYMPPEQFIDAKRTDQRSDIYSLGATLYKMLTGELAIDTLGCSVAQYVEKVLYTQPVAPSNLVAAIPKAVDEIILKCLAKKPEDRYQTPQQILQDLKNVNS